MKTANVLLKITTVLLALAPLDIRRLYTRFKKVLLIYLTGLAMVVPQAGFAQGSGKALDFDGTDDYVTQSYDSDFDFGTGSFIASGWFKTSGAAGGSGSISVRVSASSDDAEEAASGGNPNITSSDSELF